MPTEADREFVEKVRSIGHISKYKPGATQKKVVMNEDTGKPGGHHVEHYDGSQDAVARPDVVRWGHSAKGGPTHE